MTRCWKHNVCEPSFHVLALVETEVVVVDIVKIASKIDPKNLVLVPRAESAALLHVHSFLVLAFRGDKNDFVAWKRAIFAFIFSHKFFVRFRGRMQRQHVS